ncbi:MULTISPECIES: S8 family peptidase [Niastella]|uniref:S8 family peptidase n=1 Tax=Niastella soli TaxID=2821487 RepID=A0ABS3YY10_9BACT|nr:S8 family peptidase [Niastella soli]MBO9202817.1 S8 family peptidase [Niastella soli]
MKTIMIVLVVFAWINVKGQGKNWQNLDLQDDSVFGIGINKVYADLLKNKRAKIVIVAVIDSGIDSSHSDLKLALWNNERERNNKQDDDANGYLDDVHGWNFIGSQLGNVHYDNLELTRIIRKDKRFYDSLSYAAVPEEYLQSYRCYRKLRNIYDDKVQRAKSAVGQLEGFKHALQKIVEKINKSSPTLHDFSLYQPANENEERVRSVMMNALLNQDFTDFETNAIDKVYSQFQNQLKYALNLNYDPRSIVKDNYNNSDERAYGNNDIQGPDALHGTHVGGIIAATRNNGIGIDGIADNVKLMVIRAVPDGDERDKDIANAIRYAVDNGARVINMSFGKPFSWNKKCVDNAVKYAMEKDVLIVHAAGNDGKNLDSNDNYPCRNYADISGKADAWIEVGASDQSGNAANFSNYGKETVDVFAPGVHIYSCVPGNKYEFEDGTSMAAPVVTGLAALLRGYYPNLTAIQVKDIIMKSVLKRDIFEKKCLSGGIVNGYGAFKLAISYK